MWKTSAYKWEIQDKLYLIEYSKKLTQSIHAKLLTQFHEKTNILQVSEFVWFNGNTLF